MDLFTCFFSVRLVEGPSDWEGRVLIFHDHEWGTICNDGWGIEEARVVCKQLGFYGGEALVDNEYGPGEGPIWLDETACDGTEINLSECRSNAWGVHDCGHREDSGVSCGKFRCRNIHSLKYYIEYVARSRRLFLAQI